MTALTRCSCHPADVYGGCIACPSCGHWSYDPGIGCERRKCGFVEVQQALDFAAAGRTETVHGNSSEAI